MPKYYKTDLAKIHDEGFSEHAEKSFEKIYQLIKRNFNSGLIVELGCGRGITAKKIIEHGYIYYGIDYSAEMINLAKRKAHRANFKVSTFYSEEIPKCIAVLSIGECLNYKFDAQMNNKVLKNLFKKVHNSLEENGVFIFDILEENQIKDGVTEKSFVDGKNWTVLVEKKEDKIKNEMERKIITFYKHKSSYEKVIETHVVKLYNSNKIISMLKEIGFNASKSHSYGKYKLRENQTVITSVK
jgi:SAM-dependent methyltransferase